MKNIFILLLVGALGYFIYGKYVRSGDSTSTDGYSLKTVAEKPIPKTIFFAIWTDNVLKSCADAKRTYNLSTNECEAKIKEKAKICRVDAIKNAPDEIDSPQLARELGRPYVECISPYFYCNGVEIKSEDEARQHCQ